MPRVLRQKGTRRLAAGRLPDAGPAHLLCAWLRQAGFADIAVTAFGETGLLAAAHS